MTNTNNYIGKQIGNYTIVAEIASGGFGSVYQGQHIIFVDRPVVAIKLLHAAYLGSANERESFIQEARLLEKLKHRYSLPILDAGIHEGLPYLIAEYATNGSLRAHLKRQSSHPLPVEEALTILSQIGQALQHAHDQNIIHRDLKPENILFNARRNALLADFGIAIVLKTSSIRHIDATGTPAYMAPEQFRGMISKESDQYSLGCIAYELVTGRQPFSAPDFVAMGFLHVTEAPVPPTHLNPDLPVQIEQAILKAMAKQRTDRHTDVATFIRSLHASTMSEAEIPTVLSTQAPTVLVAQTPPLAQTSIPRALQKTKEQWLAEGNAHFNASRYREALVAYEQAIQLDPTYADAYLDKGNTLYDLKRYEEALAAFERAIQLDPTYADAYYNKGNALSGLQCYEEALAAFERAIQLDPTDADAYDSKGIVLKQLGRRKEAQQAEEKYNQLRNKR